MQRILVTGGTGTLGRHVVPRLLDAGVPVRVLSRRPRRESATDPKRPAPPAWVVGDLFDGTSTRESLSGVGAIVHCASDQSRGADVRAAKNLIDVAQTAAREADGRTDGLPHIVYISIVGVDRVPLRYYRDKPAVERMIEESGLPWTILRTTQFHDLIAFLAGRLARGPVMLVPARTSFQPIDVGEVAQRLVHLAIRPAEGRVADMGGPEVRTGADLFRAYLRATGKRRPIVPVLVPGAAARGYREGGHLAPHNAVGRRTFDEFLAQRSRAAAV